MRASAAWLAVLLVACGEVSVPTSEATVVATVAAPTRFETGRQLRYRFEWHVDSESRALALLPDGGAIAAGVRLSGELSLRVLPPTERGALIGIVIDRLDEHAISMMGHDALTDPRELVGHELLIDIADDGTPRTLYLDRDAPALARTVLPGLLAQMDLRVSEGDARVATGAGLADVHYAWTNPSRLVRTLRGYSRFDAFAGGLAPQVDGRLEVELDGDHLPLRIASAELLAAADSTHEDAFRSESSFELARIDSSVVAIAAAPVLDGLLVVDPEAPPDREATDRVLAQRFSAGLDGAEIEHAIFGAGHGLMPPRDFIVRATGRLRGWPETAAELEPLFEHFKDPRARALVIDMLASGGTPEAQASMRRLLDDARLHAVPEYGQWLQRFAFLARPETSSATFLLDVQSTAVDPVRRAALYPMGMVARRIAASDPLAAGALRTRLHDELAAADDDVELRVAALAGLGNAADPADAELVLGCIDDAEPTVRGTVATALRDQLGEAATSRLVGLTADRDDFVANAALAALDHRRVGAIDGDRLAGVAMSGAFNPAIGGALVSALLRRHDESPIAELALLRMRARARDPRERGRIDATLATTH